MLLVWPMKPHIDERRCGAQDDQNELLDFATQFLPEQAAKKGLAWRTAPPPDFLWCRPSDLPEGVLYEPDLNAIRFILDRIRRTNRR